jgi:hypothetical protein
MKTTGAIKLLKIGQFQGFFALLSDQKTPLRWGCRKNTTTPSGYQVIFSKKLR